MREVEQDVPMRFAEALAIECIVADAFNFFLVETVTWQSKPGRS